MWNKFFEWYERNYLLNLSIAAGLFLIQLFHLYWLFTDVILVKLTGISYFIFPNIWGVVSTFLDYSEIPALITTTLLYLHLLNKKFTWKNLWYLLFINIQWVHILWITDEIVVDQFSLGFQLFHWANIVAWIAIVIDYLELPVIVDTAKKLVIEIKSRQTQ